MNVATKCDKHCELHDAVNHSKFESILFFRVNLGVVFSQCLHSVSVACVCVAQVVCLMILSLHVSVFS